MALHNDSAPRAIPAIALIHQEGILALLALLGLFLRGGNRLEGLMPRIGIAGSLVLGAAVGLAASLVIWLFRDVPSLRDLAKWQGRLVREWSMTDAVAVAMFSGLAEEALLRALLQPILGLVPAALIFAVLHLVPDRRLWLWPVLALGFGLVLGLLFEVAGYPAAAVAHMVINGLSLLRLRSLEEG